MQLQPFRAVNDLNVEASARIQGETLNFQYTVEGAVLDGPAPRLPVPPATSWARADELWRTTCLEAFWAVRGRPDYWEFNLSPISHGWNVYQFNSYRAPQPPKPAKDFRLGDVHITVAGNKFDVSVDLVSTRPWPALDLSLCAVIRTATGTSYLALTHGPDKPDFHLRESFTLGLSPVVSP